MQISGKHAPGFPALFAAILTVLDLIIFDKKLFLR